MLILILRITDLCFVNRRTKYPYLYASVEVQRRMHDRNVWHINSHELTPNPFYSRINCIRGLELSFRDIVVKWYPIGSQKLLHHQGPGGQEKWKQLKFKRLITFYSILLQIYLYLQWLSGHSKEWVWGNLRFSLFLSYFHLTNVFINYRLKTLGLWKLCTWWIVVLGRSAYSLQHSNTNCRFSRWVSKEYEGYYVLLDFVFNFEILYRSRNMKIYAYLHARDVTKFQLLF